jgi:protein O-GlcNAc transferase
MASQQEVKLKKKISSLTQQRKYKKARDVALELVRLNKADIESWFALSQLQEVLGEVKSAVECLYQVCQGPSPMYVPAVQKAVQLCEAHGLDQLGVAPAHELIKAMPNSGAAFFSLGLFYFNLQQFVTASPYFLKSIQLSPSESRPYYFGALSYIYVGQVSQGMELLDAHISKLGLDHRVATIKAMSSNYLHGVSDEAVFTIHKDSAAAVSVKASDSCDREKKEKVKIGYLSPDLKNHSVSFFFKAIVENHSRDRFDVYCYSDLPQSDNVTAEIKRESDHWIDCHGMSDAELYDQIQADGLDILVDLVGYAGSHRLKVFSMRAAPVQVSYLGYPNTTGLAAMDYRLSDGWADPVGMTEDQYTEQLIRLSGGFLCYTPAGDLPAIAPLPADSNNGGVCFGSFNSFLKVTSEMMGMWAELLKKLPESSVFMKARPLAEEALRERIWAYFKEQGIARARVRLQGWSEDINSHLELYNEVDIHLDTFPYNGTTTTIESLRQGVPVVSLAGSNHRSRVGCSILSQVGLDDLVAGSEKDFVDVAAGLASDLGRLRSLRQELRARVDNSSLMDRKRFIAELEESFELMLNEKV